MKKFLPFLIATLFASSFAFAQERQEPVSGVEMSTGPDKAEMVRSPAAVIQQDGGAAGTYQKVQIEEDPGISEFGRTGATLKKRGAVARSHKEAREARRQAQATRDPNEGVSEFGRTGATLKKRGAVAGAHKEAREARRQARATREEHPAYEDPGVSEFGRTGATLKKRGAVARSHKEAREARRQAREAMQQPAD